MAQADNPGTAYNNQPSQDRALAVRRQLIADGTGAVRIKVSGRGHDEPVASKASAACRAGNRRMQIVITPT